MKKRIIFFILLLTNRIFCNEVYLDLEKIGKRKENVLYAKFDSGKIIISKEEIEKFQSISIAELLRLYGFDTYARSNAQSDITFYGGTFQQISVLVNGVNVSDKQTAHHNLNIPINVRDVEQIEITKNSQSNLDGINSLIGSVNIITRQGDKFFLKDEIKIFYGSNDTFNFGINKSFNKNILSIEHENSSGYRPNTDYSIYNIYYQNTKKLNKLDLTYSLGYADRNFGAQNFYAVNRIEYEKIKTLLAILNTKYFLNKTKIICDLMFRLNEDYYTTQRYDPQRYNNNHISYIYSLNTKSIFMLQNDLNIILGIDNRYDELYSRGSSTLFNWRGMGNFYDFQSGFYTQLLKKYNAVDITTNFRTDWYSRFGQKNSYGIDLELNLLDSWKLISTFKQSGRVPSYTELYYWDPNNTGSIELKTEQTEIYDIGTKFVYQNIFFMVKGFKFYNKNLIDWIKDINSTSWKIDNVAEADTNGLDIGVDIFSTNISPRLRINTIILDRKIFVPQGKELKYADNWPEKYFSMVLFPDKFYGINSTISLVYKKMTKTNPKEFFLLDTVFSKEIGSITFFVKAKNIFDIQYEELQNIVQPGRQIFSGIEYWF